MSGLLSGLMSLGRRSGQSLMNYDDAKKRAADGSVSVRCKLAKRANVQPEILYFLAEDTDPEVRREIAANPSTPVQADQLLATDDDENVRWSIAGKIARLAPELTETEREKAGDIVTGILETLARDQAVKIRQVLAEELKDARGIPAGVVEQLARDTDAAVCGPVLQKSPLLSDDFLIEIIRSSPVRAALEAISRRGSLGADIADAIVETDDRESITSLLSNKSAQIREETLDRLVDSAADVDDWHAPLVARPSLSARAVTTLSRFVADSLLEDLMARKDLDPEVTEAVGANVRRRIDESGSIAGEEESAETEIDKVRRLLAAGKLAEEQVKDAMMRGNRLFVIEALAALGQIPSDVVRKAFSMASAKGVAAVAWKAGLTADLAHQLQLRLARVPPSEALKAVDGGYALSEKDLDWQIEFFGG